jgi:uncharacterized protein (UPF0332 family)
MKQVDPLLKKAQENISAAQLLLNEGHEEIAASRAYYAMFYIAEALLFSKGMAFNSHSAVIAGFGREFSKTNLLPPEFHRYLMDAFETRQISDYDIDIELSQNRASEIIERARLFLMAASEYLSNL